jgi:type I restriction enzyme, S subunit
MNEPWQTVEIGEVLAELPKSRIPAGEADDRGAFDFYCSSAVMRTHATCLHDGPAIIFGTGGEATVHLASRPFSHSTDTWAVHIRESSGLSQSYAFRLFELALPKIDYAGFEGSGLRHLRKDYVRRLRFGFPPRRDQRRVVEVLDCVDAAIRTTEALIEKHQQIKAGLMHDLFTRGVLASGELRPARADAPQLYREQLSTWFPECWQFERLDSLAMRGSGHTPNKDVAEYWNGGVKWVSLADSQRLDALYISDTASNISYRGIQNSSAVLHPAGTVVLSRDAGVGKSAITTEPMAVSQHFMCWKCEQRLDNHFLYYWLQFHKRTFENIAMGSTILTIGLPYFKKLRIACPVDLEEQRLIATRLKAADENLFALQRRLSKLRAQKLGLMQDLLTGRVSVNGVVAQTEPSHA